MSYRPKLTAHRGETEPEKIIRLNETFDTAVRVVRALGPDAPMMGGWPEELLALHDHKGDLTATWRSANAKIYMAWAVEAAWRAQNEFVRVVHVVRTSEDDIPY